MKNGDLKQTPEAWNSPICTRLISDISRLIKTTEVVLMLVWEIIDFQLLSHEQSL